MFHKEDDLTTEEKTNKRLSQITHLLAINAVLLGIIAALLIRFAKGTIL
jgi:hypothetical protein